MSLNPEKVAVKCLEVSKCFSNKTIGISSYHLEDTILVGDMARLAVNLRQSENLNPEQIAAIGDVLNIDYRIINSGIMPLMEKFGWLYPERGGLYEEIPPLDDVLRTLGNHWEESEPSNIDISIIKSLSILNNKPASKEALQSEIGVPVDDFEMALDYGTKANCFGSFKSDESDEEIIWTPYYWNRNSERALRFLKRQTYEEFSGIERLSNYLSNKQGIPIEQVTFEENLLKAGSKVGFFPSNGISNPVTGDEHEYIFKATPQFDLDPKKDIFEKTRLIVASLRHGQYHASVTKIRSPLNVLYALRENRLSPHSYAKAQYGLLAMHKIVKIDEVSDHGGSYRITFIDSPENKMACDMAATMLDGEVPIEGLAIDPEIDLIKKGSFIYSANERQIKTIEKISDCDQFNKMLEFIQGRGLRR